MTASVIDAVVRADLPATDYISPLFKEFVAVSEISIIAELRTEFGKGGARRTRRAGKVPGVIYGHGRDPKHVALPGHELMLALKSPNVLLNLQLDGKAQLVLPKAIQRDPIKGFLQHVDLVIVRRGEKVTVEVPLKLIGEVVSDALVNQELTQLSVEAEATHIPAELEISIDGLNIGANISAGDVSLPQGVALAGDPEQTVLTILAAPTAAQVEAELAESVAGPGVEAAAEPEAGEAQKTEAPA